MIRALLLAIAVLFCAHSASLAGERDGHGGGGGGGGMASSGQRGGFGGMQHHDYERGGGNWARMGHSAPQRNVTVNNYRYGNWGGGGHWGGDGYRGGYGYGGGFLGGVLGGILGTTVFAPEPQVIVVPQEMPEAPLIFCSQKYRTFNPETGTYMGYDGLAHAAVGCQ